MSAVAKQIAQLKKTAQIATLQARIQELKAKPLPGVKKAGAKTKATKSGGAKKKPASPKKSKTPKVQATTTAPVQKKKTDMKIRHIGPAKEGQTIIHEKLTLEPGYMYVIHMEGAGKLDVKDYDFKGGAMRVVNKE